jgi:hypothetical protein
MTDRLVFIIRDFEVDGYVGLALQFLAQYPPAGTKLSVPGIPGAAEQGRLIEDVVDPALAKSQYVIAFMDTPNANVGFELGFALGSGRYVALVCAVTELPQWLDAAPLSGYLVAKGVQLPKLQRIIELGEHVTVDGSPLRGTDILFLSPHTDEGLVGHALASRLYPDWRSAERTGWKLQDLPTQLDGIGEVVWLITPFAEGADRKDGQGNSLNAVIAGYAKGKGIPLRILKSTYTRRIVDIEDQANLFTNLDELHKLFREADEKRKVALAGSIVERPPVPETTLERIFTKESYVNLDWYRRGVDIAKAVGRLSIAGKAVATCFLLSPRHVLTPSHVFSLSGAIDADKLVVFERAGAGPGEVRRAKSLAWNSDSAELDVAILDLDAPVTDISPLSLRGSRQTQFNMGDRVVVVGYPYGGALSFSLSESVIVGADEHSLRYSTPTAPGSSGSPVFGANWDLLAMHHASRSVQGLQGSEWVSEGIRASAILAALDQSPSIQSELRLAQES